MCGIVGYVGPREAVPVVLDALRHLEYRGYDSAGIAVSTTAGIVVLRAAGKLANLVDKAYAAGLRSHLAIGHTRWATHGAPTEANAHPHTDDGPHPHTDSDPNADDRQYEYTDANAHIHPDAHRHPDDCPRRCRRL